MINTAPLLDVKRVVNTYGSTIELEFNAETDITRGDYKDRKRWSGTVITIKAFPIEFNPSPKMLEKLGVTEKIDVLAYTSTQDWVNKTTLYKDMEKANIQMKIDSEIFENRIVRRFSQFADKFLYVIFGGIRV